MEALLLVLDLLGTFVFALSGAMAGVKHRLDLLGVLVLSYAAGNAGGIARDLLIGAVPPAAFSDWRYLGVSLLAGIVTFWRPFAIDRLRSPVLLFDAAGLGLFAVAGTQKALAFGLNPVMAACWVSSRLLENLEKLQALYESAPYKQAVAIGDKYATQRIFGVEGVLP